MEINVNFHESMNVKYQDLYWNEDRKLFLYGGAGSGKSYFAIQKLIARSLIEKNHNFLIVRKTLNANKLSCYPLTIELLNYYQIPYSVNKTDYVIELTHCNSTFKFMGIGIGAESVEKMKSIQGKTGIFIEEMTEFSQEEVQQLNLRLRGKTGNYKQLMGAFNPIITQRSKWINQQYFNGNTIKKGLKNTTIIHTVARDNKFIDEEYHEVLNDIKDPTLRKIYLEGLWAEVKGKVYNNYEVIDFSPDLIQRCLTSNRFNGVDFGFNHPAADIFMSEIEKDVYIFDEIYARGKTTAELIELQRKKSKNYKESEKVKTYCDSANPDKIEEGNRAGLNWTKANKDIVFGIDQVKSKKIYINSSCVNLIKELDTYRYEELSDGTFSDKPIKEMDDACDAMRYGIASHLTKKEEFKPFILPW